MKNYDGNYITCSGNGKICYTQREAGTVINSAKKHHRNDHFGRNKTVPKRKYYCKECGYYHVTHLALYDFDSHDGLWENAFYKEMDKLRKKNKKTA